MTGVDNIRSGHVVASSTLNSESSVCISAKKNELADTDNSMVSLSQQSKDIDEISNKIAILPTFDTVKVKEIKKAINNGSYTVDSEKLADNMIKFEKELGGL
ncbi:negative regulator of flagellin synthesis [Candidatus Photodesmus blepharus]|uniref:Negative regulator of flagellin synthesis n=1 Tax=Candidatus Photodesmus blepharonis TaxID=1179155 RepID=A0A084CMG6_9GAMM|nr:flagellar biosynthesis anti-sigma factor FlgM [Candidatus Photodesmus blepharus]KEY90995.1 negative regulator of flagellin synthesis [Candidatus Photodesmus blepharus]